MSKEVVFTENAPAALGPYNQAISVSGGTTIYVSGQLGLDPKTGELVSDSFEAQVRQAMANLQAVIEAAGASLSDIVRVGLYLTDLNNFGIANTVMAEIFPEPHPARSTIEICALPKGGLFEIDAIVVKS